MYQKVSEVVIFIFSAGAALLHLLTVSGQARSLKQLNPVTLTAAQKLSCFMHSWTRKLTNTVWKDNQAQALHTQRAARMQL